MARPKGSPNRNKQFLINRLQDMFGDDFHPIMKMATNANRLQSLVDEAWEARQKAKAGEAEAVDAGVMGASLQDAITAWDKVAQYTEPKLKALEVTGGLDVGALSREELSERIRELEQRGTG